jgi:hypothetical protein
MVVGLSAGNTGTLALNGGVVTVDSNLVVGNCGASVTGEVVMTLKVVNIIAKRPPAL